MLNCSANVTPRLSGWGKCQLLRAKAIGERVWGCYKAREAGLRPRLHHPEEHLLLHPSRPAWPARLCPSLHLNLSPHLCPSAINLLQGEALLNVMHPLGQQGKPLKTMVVRTLPTHRHTHRTYSTHTPHKHTCTLTHMHAHRYCFVQSFKTASWEHLIDRQNLLWKLKPLYFIWKGIFYVPKNNKT